MTKEIKTELTRDELKELLDIYNTIDAMVHDTIEMMDVRMSQLSDVREKAFALKNMFSFRPRMGEDGSPNHWQPCVLPDDANAWYFKEATE